MATTCALQNARALVSKPLCEDACLVSLHDVVDKITTDFVGHIDGRGDPRNAGEVRSRDSWVGARHDSGGGRKFLVVCLVLSPVVFSIEEESCERSLMSRDEEG